MSSGDPLKTNSSNQIRDYKKGESYKKYDIVFDREGYRFLYAKNDIAYAGGHSITEPRRFLLLGGGPSWGGKETYYLYDLHNKLNLVQGTEIVITNSSFGNDGRFLVIETKLDHSEKDVSPGDFLLNEVLSAEEYNQDKFNSEWFLAGISNFDWRGRDWKEYVMRDVYGLLPAYEAEADNFSSIEEWGRQHYANYGEAENRPVPMLTDSNKIWVPSIDNNLIVNIEGFNQENSKDSLDPNEKSLYFNFDGMPDLYFFTKRKYKIANENKAYVWFEDYIPPYPAEIWESQNLNVDFSNNINEVYYDQNSSKVGYEPIDRLKFSDDGLTCVIKKKTSIEVYNRASASSDNWTLKHNENVSSTFHVAAISDDCSRIAYINWPSSKAMNPPQITNRGNEWLNGRSTGIQRDISRTVGYVEAEDIEDYQVATLHLDLRVRGEVYQVENNQTVPESKGCIQVDIESGSLSDVSWESPVRNIINLGLSYDQDSLRSRSLSFSPDQDVLVKWIVYGKWSIDERIRRDPENKELVSLLEDHQDKKYTILSMTETVEYGETKLNYPDSLQEDSLALLSNLQSYFNTDQLIGDSQELKFRQSSGYTEEHLVRRWKGSIERASNGSLNIIEASINGYQNIYSDVSPFFVGNFTSDNTKLLMCSRLAIQLSGSTRVRVRLLNLNSNSTEFDIKAATSSSHDKTVQNINGVANSQLPPSFISFMDCEVPAVISRDGTILAVTYKSEIGDTFRNAPDSIAVYKKNNQGDWSLIHDERYAPLNNKNTSRSEVSISGNNKVITIVDGELHSWAILESFNEAQNDYKTICKKIKTVSAADFGFFEEREIDGTINWDGVEYNISRTLGNQNMIYQLSDPDFKKYGSALFDSHISRSSGEETKILIGANRYISNIEKNLNHQWNGHEVARIFKYNEVDMSWSIENDTSDVNFNFFTHVGCNEDLSQIMMLNVLPPGQNDQDVDYNLDTWYDENFPVHQNNRKLYISRRVDRTSYLFNIKEGWSLFEKSARFDEGFAFDIFIQEENKWWSIRKGLSDRRKVEASPRTDVPVFNIDFTNEARNQLIPETKKSRIWIHGISDQDSVDRYEESGGFHVSMPENVIGETDTADFWSSDEFFFDPDYGSTVKYKANNTKQEFGNGYYRVQPKGINSLSFSANLKFKNRNSRESNAIVHFLENKLGQHERQEPSNNLKYTQGISGFKWGGSSTFHPYDTTKTQMLDFYCFDFSHSLNFEDSNDIDLTIKNFDFSTIRMEDGGFVRRAEEYSPSEYYEVNDVVFVSEINRYYYCKSPTQIEGVDPYKIEHDNEGNSIINDINTDSWSRSFFWSPSLGLSISQKPRLHDISLGKGYTQIYNDGINESLLDFTVNFNNRNDKEARAILHFLEQHKGFKPFQFTLPAPYDRVRNFVCEEWSHEYKYKNNHSISAKFMEHPVLLSAENFDKQIYQNQPHVPSPAKIVGDSTLVFRKPRDSGDFDSGLRYRVRGKVTNIGNEALTVTSIRGLSHPWSFKVIGNRNFDYATYVNFYPDLDRYWYDYIKDQLGLTKYEWGKQHWSEWGGKTEYRIMPARSFNFSQQFLNSEKTSAGITRLYSVLFGRTPSSQEINGWMSGSLLDIRRVLYSMMDSDEYKWGAIKYGRDDFSDEFLNEVPSQESMQYIWQTLLGRDVDSGAIDYYINNNADVFNKNIHIHYMVRTSDEFLNRIGLELGTSMQGINPIEAPLFTEQGLEPSDYIIDLPVYDENNFKNLQSDTLNLYGAKIKIVKNSFVNGSNGQIMFDLLDSDLKPIGRYIQKNTGNIFKSDDRNISLLTDYYINEEFIKKNRNPHIQPGETKFFEVTFDLFEVDLDIPLITLDKTELMFEDENGDLGNLTTRDTSIKDYSGYVRILSSASDIKINTKIYT